ncbi:MAG: hypothetical protein ABIR47_13385 [Candidatus Kapaibacterium sp.]
MNIAFPALVILLLALPGILLRYAYRKGLFWKSPVILGPLADEVGGGIIAALVLHALCLLVIEVCSHLTVDFESLLILLTGWPKLDVRQEQGVLYSISHYHAAVLIYFIGSNLLGVVLGYGLHWLVRVLHLDLRYSALRFSNEWHYIFWGEKRAFDQKLLDIKLLLTREVDITHISAVVDEGGESLLYWGILTEYHFNRAGELDLIVLEQASRRKLSADRQIGNAADEIEEERFYPIRGDYLTLRYTNIRNLNIQYIVLPDDT